MIISKTPYRLSFFGGGTDMPKWYLKNNGQVLSTTINKYIYLTMKNLPSIFKENIRLVYSKTELVNKINEIKHPSFRETLRYMKIYKNVDIHYLGDLPAYSGIGSSSAFTVGLLNVLSHYKGINIQKKNLGLKSIYIEQKKIKEYVGSQDQIAVSVGGLNHIYFNKNGNINVKKLNIKKNTINNLQRNLLLFYTGIKRNSNNIQEQYIKKIFEKKIELNKIYKSVNLGISLLKNGKLDDFGLLMNEMWQLKKKLNNRVSNDFIDEIYNEAINNGALGGKITGAGGGGFLLFYAKNKFHSKIKNKLSKLKHVSFKFENEGSKIIYNK